LPLQDQSHAATIYFAGDVRLTAKARRMNVRTIVSNTK
jgi:hypothetical protein